MEGYKDPFNRRTYPWGREDWEFLAHFKRLGQLRKDHEVLRLGDIRFFQAGDKHIGYSRTYNGKTLKIYANRSGDTWEIESGRVILAYNMQVISTDSLIVGPRGFCIVEE